MAKRNPKLLVVLSLLAALGAAGCKEKQAPPPPWSPPVSGFYARTATEQAQEEKPFVYEAGATYEAVVKTSRGAFRLAFYPQETPETVRNFVLLAANHYYDGQLVYKVLSDELIETGDPDNLGTGGPGDYLKGEFTARTFEPGTVGAGRKPNNKNSSGSIWFVSLKREPQWDGQFAAFGYVKEGLDVVRQISELPVEGDLAVFRPSRQRPADPPVVQSIEIITVKAAPAAVSK